MGKYLGDTMDLTNFEYRSGKMCHPLNNRKVQSSGNNNRSSSTSIGGKSSNGRLQGSSSSGHGSNRDNNSYDLARGLRADAGLVPPIRQTASIFKQPVTVHKTSSENKVKVDKNTTTEKPKQLYWEKRLSGLRPSYPQ